MNWSAIYVLRGDDGKACGRLTANLLNISKPPLTDQFFQLEISVLGIPKTMDPEGVAEFHNMAHEKIVNYFASVTTEPAQAEWERIQ